MASATRPRELPQMNRLTAEYLPKFLDIIAAAFTEMALTTTFICEIDKIPPPYPVASVTSVERRREYFGQGIIDSVEAGAIMVEAGDSSAIALWEPPNFQGVPFIDAVQNAGPIRAQWTSGANALKAKCLAPVDIPSNTEESATITLSEEGKATVTATTSAPGPVVKISRERPHWHLAFLARNPLPDAPHVPGAVSAVVLPFLAQARAEGVPVWVEAASAYARDVYVHYGFRAIDEVTCGVGKINEDGWPQEGGPGLTAYPMIYDAHLQCL